MVSTWDSIINSSDEIRVFSESSKRLVEKSFPSAPDKIKIIPHSTDYKKSTPMRVEKSSGLRIGICGIIGRTQ